MQDTIIIRLKDDLNGKSLYERTRKEWRVSGERINNINYAFSLFKGVVKEVYNIKLWYPIPERKRYAFKGNLAESATRQKYIGKDLNYLFKKGNSNPIMYISLKELDESLFPVSEENYLHNAITTVSDKSKGSSNIISVIIKRFRELLHIK